MPKETVEALVEGGKATAAPPLGPALGPLGVNIGQIITEINKKTGSFKGMQVPIKVIVDKETKNFEVTVGTPPASALIKAEAKIEKGSGKPNTDLVADILIEQAIKISKMKEDSLSGKTLKDRVKEIIGTCQSMGILVEGKRAQETLTDINAGKFDEEIRLEKTELSAEELKKLEEEKKRLAAEIEKRRAEFESAAKKIVEELKGKARAEIKARMIAAGIPEDIYKALLPVDEKTAAAQAEAGAKAAAPAGGAKPEAAAAKK